MNYSDFFINYTEKDLKYEFDMLNQCKNGMSEYEKQSFLYNLCLEGWLLHARRLIESFGLDKDSNWAKFGGLISKHLSHAKPTNRSDHRHRERENPEWRINEEHPKLIEDLKVVTENNTRYPHYDLLVKILRESNK